MSCRARFWDRGFGGSNVADFWVRPSDRYILLDLLLEEISGIRGLPCRPAKILQKWEIFIKKLENAFFRSWEVKIDSQGAGEVSDVFLVCHGVLLLTNVDHPREIFLTRRTPFPSKSSSQKRQFLHFFRQKNLIFEIVAEISDRKCCRNCWQHAGNPPSQKCPETRFHEIWCIIRKVINF